MKVCPGMPLKEHAYAAGIVCLICVALLVEAEADCEKKNQGNRVHRDCLVHNEHTGRKACINTQLALSNPKKG